MPPVASVSAQDVPNAEQPVLLSKILERKFKRDAARLALRAISKDENLKSKDITIPAQEMADFYKLLTTVYRQSPKAQAIERCNVHTFPDPSIDHLIVVFKKSAPWAGTLQPDRQPLENRFINELLRRYDLVIEKIFHWDKSHNAMTIRAKEPVNMAALAQELAKVEGVTEIDLGIPETRGNDIRASRQPGGGWEVSYILRFGAHVGGGGKIHTWTFRMTDDGIVHFVGENGDKIPEWMECK